jgi:transcription elongation GreA/GreB family factor
VKYLTEDRKTVQITISKKKSDPSLGVVYYETPIARALLGAEVGDEVEVLVGSYVRPAIVEQIIKPAMSA